MIVRKAVQIEERVKGLNSIRGGISIDEINHIFAGSPIPIKVTAPLSIVENVADYTIEASFFDLGESEVLTHGRIYIFHEGKDVTDQCWASTGASIISNVIPASILNLKLAYDWCVKRVIFETDKEEKLTVKHLCEYLRSGA